MPRRSARRRGALGRHTAVRRRCPVVVAGRSCEVLHMPQVLPTHVLPGWPVRCGRRWRLRVVAATVAAAKAASHRVAVVVAAPVAVAVVMAVVAGTGTAVMLVAVVVVPRDRCNFNMLPAQFCSRAQRLPPSVVRCIGRAGAVGLGAVCVCWCLWRAGAAFRCEPVQVH